MRIKPYAAVILTLCALFSAGSYSEAGEYAAASSSVVLPEKEYEFEPVLEGARVTHEFVIQNKGSVPLRIVRVKPG